MVTIAEKKCRASAFKNGARIDLAVTSIHVSKPIKQSRRVFVGARNNLGFLAENIILIEPVVIAGASEIRLGLHRFDLPVARMDEAGYVFSSVGVPVCPPSTIPLDFIADWETTIRTDHDPFTLLVYADWCEERGWPERAAQLRNGQAEQDLEDEIMELCSWTCSLFAG